MKRRPFLKMIGGAAGLYSLGGKISSSTDSQAPQKDILYRKLGRSDDKIPVVGFPGLALVHYEQDEGSKALHKAFDRGLTYFDVAPAYGDGEAEIKMGIGLQGIDRSKIFLSCKTKMRDKEGARMELERSLKRLKTDYFDLYQLHHLHSLENLKPAFASGGAMETILKAKEDGLIRHIGFSAHTTRGALYAMKEFQFDTVMFPINYVENYTHGFGNPVLDLAEEQGAAVLAIKAIGSGFWPNRNVRTRDWWYRNHEEQDEIDLAMRFVLSRKNVVAGIPASFLDMFDKTANAGCNYRPPTDEELGRLKALAKNSLPMFQTGDQETTSCEPINYYAYARNHPQSNA